MKHNILAVFTSIILLIAAFPTVMFAQLSGSFVADVTSGCEPHSVNFTASISGGTAPYSYNWDFGDGSTGIQPTPNSSHTYNSFGSFDVVVTITDDNGQSTVITNAGFIDVLQNPIANISSDVTSGCEPLDVNFTDASTLGDAPIDTWKWDFGDGVIEIINSGNPATHTYMATPSTTYQVSLEITDTNGCQSAISIPNYITVAPQPTIGFSADETIACVPPLSVNFTNSSSTGLQYNWDFGNGQFSTSENPTTVTYSSAGLFDVALTVTDPAGCSIVQQVDDMIQITDVVANFSAPTGCTSGPLQFDNSSTVGANSYSWDFGDGSNGTGNNTSHQYTTAGTYTVVLIAENTTAGCADTVSQTITVEDFTADFSISETYNCNPPFDVNFTDNSGPTAVATWQWDMGAGNTSTSQNPTATYSSDGIYDVNLTVTTANGCTSVLSQPNAITVSSIEASFGVAYPTPEVCPGSSITLTDNSTPDMNGALNFWQWDFGDGNSNSNVSGGSVTNVYADAGDYVASLTVTNVQGCFAVTTMDVEVGEKLNPTFTISTTNAPDSSCAINDVEFAGSSDDDAALESSEWIWEGTGGFGGTGQDFTHQYNLIDALGWNQCSLIVDYNGCKDTIVDSVFIVGPIIEAVDVMQFCENPDSIIFATTMIDTTHYTWSWDDSFPDLASPPGGGNIPAGTDNDSTGNFYHNPYHLYNGLSTTRNVTLTAYNSTISTTFDADQCTYEYSTEFYIRHVSPFVDVKDSICVNEINTFDASTAQDGVSWIWDFGNGRSSNLIIDTSSYADTGMYTVVITVTDAIGCNADTSFTMNVYQPYAGFSTSAEDGCVPFDVTFIDTSLYPGIPAQSYQWNLSNTTIQTTATSTALYQSKGVKTISLTITDALGCVGTAQRNVEALQPTAIFSASDQTLCAGGSTVFNSLSLGYTGVATTSIASVDWDFGDGSTGNSTSTNHGYANAGTYDIELIATDDRGCTDTISQTAFINVQDIPVADFVSSDLDNGGIITDTINCYPATFQYTDASLHLDTTAAAVNPYQWVLGNGNSSFLQNPATTYNLPGTYTVQLIATSSYGCIDSISKNVVVRGPLADFSISVDSVCKGVPVDFNVYFESFSDNYQWDFGDASPFGSGNPITHAYQQTGDREVVLTYYDATGDCEQDTSHTLFVHEVSANFNRGTLDEDTMGCEPFTVDIITDSYGGNSWSWDYGNGTTSTTSANSTQTYDAGTYNVVYAISSSIGCVDTAVKQIVVHPEPITSISNDTIVCYGTNVPLLATGGVTYQWIPESNLSDTTTAATLANPTPSQTEFAVTIIDANGCEGYESVTLDVVKTSLLDTSNLVVTSDTSFGGHNFIAIGDTALLEVVIDDEIVYTYNWSPATNIDCSDCESTSFSGLETTTFLVTVTDEGEVCPPAIIENTVVVLDIFSADLPDLFSPNGDNMNDTVYLAGYGIKELISYEVFNRWGEKVYENPGDLNHGWDGNFKGKPQNMDTYIGVATIKRFNDETHTIKKHITLLR